MPSQLALKDSSPSPQLLEVLPALRRLDQELAATLTPAMTATDHPDGYTQAAWMTAKLLRFLLQAAAAGDAAEHHASLVEVEADAAAVIRAVHQVRATLSDVGELAAAEVDQGLLDLDDTVVVHRADLVVTLPTGELADSSLPVTVGVDGHGWVTVHSSHAGFGPIDGPAQLGVAGALRTLGQALTQCWQPPEQD